MIDVIIYPYWVKVKHISKRGHCPGVLRCALGALIASALVVKYVFPLITNSVTGIVAQTTD